MKNMPAVIKHGIDNKFFDWKAAACTMMNSVGLRLLQALSKENKKKT